MKKIYLQPETDSSWLQSDRDWMQGALNNPASSETTTESGQSLAPARMYI